MQWVIFFECMMAGWQHCKWLSLQNVTGHTCNAGKIFVKKNNSVVVVSFNLFNMSVVIWWSTVSLFSVSQPSNIFFSLDGSVKVGDFGLVTAHTSENNMETPIKGKATIKPNY